MIKSTTSFVLILIFCALFLRTNASKKCLLPNFESNETLDGLDGCVCEKNLEYDDQFGICFENKCKDYCNEMDCSIRKLTKNRFEYLCGCKAGYEALSPIFKLKCITFETMPGHQMVSKNLPKNPLLMKQLNCSQAYEPINDTYRCTCFDGYEMNEKTGDCKPIKKCDRKCNQNQICTVDAQNNQRCVCKTGFIGQNCRENFCDLKNVTNNERTYLELSTLNVCGTKQCKLNDQDNFQCECRSGMELSTDGLCKIKKPCLPGEFGYQQCSKKKNQLCAIKTKENDSFRCNCEHSLGYNLQATCNDFVSKFKKSKNLTFGLRMKMRLDFNSDNEMFLALFMNRIWNSLGNDIEFALPSFAYNEFIDYEQKVFETYETIGFNDWYQPILDERLKNLFVNGLKRFEYLNKCQNHTIYPQIVYDRTSLKLTKLVQTVFDVNYLVFCENDHLFNTNDLLDSFTNDFLLNEYDGYLYFKRTGFVIPETIELIKLN